MIAPNAGQTPRTPTDDLVDMLVGEIQYADEMVFSKVTLRTDTIRQVVATIATLTGEREKDKEALRYDLSVIKNQQIDIKTLLEKLETAEAAAESLKQDYLGMCKVAAGARKNEARYLWLRDALDATDGEFFIGVDSVNHSNRWGLAGNEADIAIDREIALASQETALTPVSDEKKD